MIEIKELQKKYPKVHALKGVSLEVGTGELFAYLGPNGSGKTTTIRILTGLTKSTSGTASLNGFNIHDDIVDCKKQFGLVTQAVNLDQELTVNQNLDIHGRLHGMDRKSRGDAIARVLDYVELSERKDSRIMELSGGMKRRVMIARAMMHDPKILFLDEPTAGLDPVIRRKIWSLIKKIQQQGTTVFLTTHYIEEAEFLADRVAFLEEGQIVAVNSPQHFIDEMGNWAVDVLEDNDLETKYFKKIENADEFISGKEFCCTKRRVNLEDAFIAKTGLKIAENGGLNGAATSAHSGGHGSRGHGAHGGHGSHGNSGHGGHGTHGSSKHGNNKHGSGH